MAAYQSAMKRLGHTAAFAFVMKRILPPVDRLLSKLSGGRITFGQTVVPTFVVIHRGAKSGKEYHTPLSYITHGDGFALAASNWGGESHPAWSYNLLAHPDISVVAGHETIAVRARHVSDEEKAQLWPSFVAMWPAYATYEKRASHRNIRVFVLDRR